jgi:hypothetical protein
VDDRLSLRPTPEQYAEFGDYLGRAHSWYKHLPLMTGRRFVVFVAPDAGIGRLVAVRQGEGYKIVTPPEGPEFTEQHPRIHYGWTTTKEYRTRFGYLDYVCRRGPDEPYARDAGPPPQLPARIEERCGFVLYPYVSGTFDDAITWSVHQEALAQLRAGADHPARDVVLMLADFARARKAAWPALTEAEQLWVLSRDMPFAKPLPGEPSAGLRTYLDLDERVDAVAGPLRHREVEKIRRALAELDDWLLHGG